MDIEFFTRFLAAFFAMLNPLAAMPVFLSLTEGEDEASRRRMAINGCAPVASSKSVTPRAQ